jgi:hypothetical protein
MKKFLICLCLAWLIHFPGGRTVLVDKLQDGVPSPLEWSRRAYFIAVKDGKQVIIPWFQVLYIEEVK